MINPEVLISVLRSKGPSVPAQLKKEVGVDSLLVSAMLSNLVGAKKVKLSHLKIGTSPLYYLPGQEEQLTQFIEKLPEKERKAVHELQEHIVLRDQAQSAVMRYALREAKDYAEPLTVTIQGAKETFWKWYLASDEVAEQHIRTILDTASAPAKVEKPKDTSSEKPKEEPTPPTPKPKASTPPKKSKENTKDEEGTTMGRAVKAIKNLVSGSVVSPNDEYADDPFYLTVFRFFAEQGIAVESEECVRKKSEYDFHITIDSPVGPLHYYCKAKSKKKLNDGDISTFFLKAQSQKRPVLLITTGELTKKAQELLDHELKGLTVKQIGR